MKNVKNGGNGKRKSSRKQQENVFATVARKVEEEVELRMSTIEEEIQRRVDLEVARRTEEIEAELLETKESNKVLAEIATAIEDAGKSGNIRNILKQVLSNWDWEFLNSCFTRGIAVSDIDGIVEANGKFLVIETKHTLSPISGGQRRMHEELVKTGLFTVMYVYGDKPGVAEEIEILHPRIWGSTCGVKSFGRRETTPNGFKSQVRNWFLQAENK